MPGWQDWFRWETVTGSPAQAGDVTVTPVAKALVVRPPFAGTKNGRGTGALVWNRPVAVLVERGGEVTRQPIVDVTRLAQVALLLGSVLAIMSVAGARRARG